MGAALRCLHCSKAMQPTYISALSSSTVAVSLTAVALDSFTTTVLLSTYLVYSMVLEAIVRLPIPELLNRVGLHCSRCKPLKIRGLLQDVGSFLPSLPHEDVSLGIQCSDSRVIDSNSLAFP